MPSLDTTNAILGVLAAVAVLELLIVIGAAIWLLRWAARLEHTLTAWESTHLAPLRARAEMLLDQLRELSTKAHRIGDSAERAAGRVHAVMDAVDREVDRTARGARSAFHLVEHGYQQLKAFGAGLGEGLRAILPASWAGYSDGPHARGNGRGVPRDHDVAF